MHELDLYQPTEEMKRITRQELADHFDEILETIEKDDVGFVVEDPAGKNDVLLCPAHWYNFCFDDSFGCIVNSALRYAVGRHTYMPGVVRNFIRKYKNVLDEKTLAVAIRDINDALCYGGTEDAEEWKKLRDELQKRLHEKREI